MGYCCPKTNNQIKIMTVVHHDTIVLEQFKGSLPECNHASESRAF